MEKKLIVKNIHAIFTYLILNILPIGSIYSEDSVPANNLNVDNQQQTNSDDIRSATVDAIDGTKINMLVTEDGKAVTVATQDLTFHKKRKKKHNELNGNPVDEPLSIGLINISTMTLVEDAQPEVSNPSP
jgi:hypothetical protein